MKSVKCKRLFLLLLSVITFVSKVPVLSFADTRPVFSVSTSSNASPSSDYNLLSLGAARAPVLPSATNTVDWSTGGVVLLYLLNDAGNGRWVNAEAKANADGTLGIKYVNKIPDGYYIRNVNIYLKNQSWKASNVPPSGKYKMLFRFSSDFNISYNGFYLNWNKAIQNATTEHATNNISDHIYASGGDFSCTPGFVIDLTSITSFYINIPFAQSDHLKNFAGSFYCEFTSTTSSPDYTIGKDTSTQDYQDGITNGISDISSGVGEMSDTLHDVSDTMSGMASDTSEIKDTLTYISDSQNLIIEGIDNIILHISDQLYAFWDQLYNLIHVPTYNKLNEILAAIKSMDLDVTVDLDELKAAISALQSALVDKMESSTGKLIDSLTKSHNEDIANDNKNHDDSIANDNKNHDDLVHGFDNSGMDNDKGRLDDAIAEYDNIENQLLGDAKDTITDFTFENPLTRFVGPLQDISYFLQGVYVALGSLNIPIGFALTLMIALIFVGYYRFKGGN